MRFQELEWTGPSWCTVCRLVGQDEDIIRGSGMTIGDEHRTGPGAQEHRD